MPVIFKYDEPGWRPSWAQMLDIIERFSHEDETAEELRWLRSHPTDWLIVARYMEKRTQIHIAETRRYLKELTITDEATGRPSRGYLKAKADADRLTARRLHWTSKLLDQINEAKHILGYDKLPDDARSQLVDRLQLIRTALISDLWDEDDVIKMISGLLRTYSGDENYDPAAYRKDSPPPSS